MKFNAVRILGLASAVFACPSHENSQPLGMVKRQEGAPPPPTDWAYEASFNWGRINESTTEIFP